MTVSHVERARAWRAGSMLCPMPTLADILGQDRAVAALRSSLRAGRVHHAWVFHGPSGVGKMTTARAFAATLLDPTLSETLTGDLEPDPESETQRLIGAGVHPDLHVVTKELALFSDDAAVRARKLITIPRQVVEEHLIRPASLTARVPSGARAGKVFIVDEAELLDEGTQNAVLKTLEEPAPGTVIILVTSRESRLLPTIRSRCQRVAFGALDDSAMRAWIARDPERASVGQEQREWLLRFADGSPGRFDLARTMGLFGWWRDLAPRLEAADRGAFDPDLGKAMSDLVEGYAQAWVDAHENASKDAANKDGARQMFALLAHRAQEHLRHARDDAHAHRALSTIDTIGEAERNIDANVNMKFAFEDLAARLARA
jgi:DNA polymerase-3 subunit delta'